MGEKVALIGAGGIGFDTAEFLTASHEPPSPDAFFAEWGVDPTYQTRGGVASPEPAGRGREVTMLQRAPGKLGMRLNKTTGWIHRSSAVRHGVKMIAGAQYRSIDDAGLHVDVQGEERVIEADTIVICAGQQSRRDLHEALVEAGCTVHLIGGAEIADDLDAKRAIDRGTRLGAVI